MSEHYDQRIVRVQTDDGGDIWSQYVNDPSKLDATVEDATVVASDNLEAARVTVEGRTRLNDYVGSPVWSDWTLLQDIEPVELQS